jgi:hypothetical protein
MPIRDSSDSESYIEKQDEAILINHYKLECTDNRQDDCFRSRKSKASE